MCCTGDPPVICYPCNCRKTHIGSTANYIQKLGNYGDLINGTNIAGEIFLKNLDI